MSGGATSASGLGAAGGSAAALPLDPAATVTESDAAAHRMSVAALTDKAAARVFLRLMTLPPDISDRNVRVNAKLSSPEARMSTLTMFGPSSGGAAASGDGGTVNSNDLDAAMHVSAANLSKLLHGAGAGAVVDRMALKRLAAMVSSSIAKPSGVSEVASPVGAGRSNLGSTSPRPASAIGKS
jgi:hypothetical protein